MAKLIMTKGLPAAGKTQWSKELVDKGQGRVKITCKDNLRAMLDNSAWSKQREKFIEEVQDRILSAGLIQGLTMIAADTNLAPRQEQRLRALAQSYGAEFEIKDFTDVSLEECIKRDQKRPNYVGEQVIKRMYHQYLAPKPQPRVYDEQKEDTYIFDIDGTLADLNGRNPYDASTCENDLAREHVQHLFKSLPKHHYRIIMSGREEKYRTQTERWLEKHELLWDHVLMRPTGDTRKDAIVKRELFERHVEPHFNVLFWVDDRPQVIRMVREELGIPVFDAGAGYEF